MSHGPAREQCEICGQSNPETLERHHVVPQRPPYNGSDHPSNLVKLCGSCHNAVERIYDDDFYQRLSRTKPYLAEGADPGNLGFQIDGKKSADRGFPKNPLHVVRGALPDYYLADLGIVDNNELGTVTQEDLIEQAERKLQRLQEDLEQVDPDAPPTPQSFLGEDFETATHPNEMISHASIEQSIEYTRERIEHYKEELEPGREYDDPKPIDVIHCGYCDTAFRSWEEADAAKHLQIAHHIEDPYERGYLSKSGTVLHPDLTPEHGWPISKEGTEE